MKREGERNSRTLRPKNLRFFSLIFTTKLYIQMSKKRIFFSLRVVKFTKENMKTVALGRM